MSKKITLTQKQLKIAFFQLTLKKLQNISENRESYLPLLNFHESGRKTRVEVYKTLEACSEIILRYFDLKTNTLLKVSFQGNIQLCTQTQICSLTGVSKSVLSRLFERLEQAGYVKRKFNLVTNENAIGEMEVRTHTKIVFTKLFFKHLGKDVYSEYRKAKYWASTKQTHQLQSKASSAKKQKPKHSHTKRSCPEQSWENQEKIIRHRFLAEVAKEYVNEDFSPEKIRREAERRLTAHLKKMAFSKKH